jgi:hypothetical protein
MIRSIADLIKSNLSQYGTYVATYSAYDYNSFATPNLGGIQSILFGFLERSNRHFRTYTFTLDVGHSSSYQEYIEHLKKKFNHVSKSMLQLQRHQQIAQNEKIAQKLNTCPLYTEGQLVYLYKPNSSSLAANSRKLSAFWVGVFAIYKVFR